MRKIKETWDSAKLQRSSDLLRAIAHPLRMTILEFIDKNRSINVNKIYSTLQIEQSITSQHLKILRQTGIVNTHREGKFIHYTIDYALMAVASECVREFMKNNPIDDLDDDEEEL